MNAIMRVTFPLASERGHEFVLPATKDKGYGEAYLGYETALQELHTIVKPLSSILKVVQVFNYYISSVTARGRGLKHGTVLSR